MDQNSFNDTVTPEKLVEDMDYDIADMEVVIEDVDMEVQIAVEPVKIVDNHTTPPKYVKVKDISELKHVDETSLLQISDNYSDLIYTWLPASTPQPPATPERAITPVSWTSGTDPLQSPATPKRVVNSALSTPGSSTPRTPTTPKRALMSPSSTPGSNTSRTPKTPKRALMSPSSTPGSNTPRTPKTPKRALKSPSSTPGWNTPRTPTTPKRALNSASSTPGSNTPRTPKTPKRALKSPSSTPGSSTPRTPTTPKWALKSASSTPGSCSKRFVVDETGNLLSDSGSDDDDHEWAGRDILMRDFARRLRELQCEDEEPDGGEAVVAHGEDAEINRESYTEVARGEETMNVESDRAGFAHDPEQYTFSWSDNYDTFSGQEEVYRRDPGPKIASSDPLEIFSAIWDVTILGIIVKQTNLYAWQTIAAYSERGRIPKYLDAWVETTIEEMRRLFAMMMLMTLDVRGCVGDYWATDILQMPSFREIMSRNRFTLLMRFLHFQDNTEIPMNLTSYEKKIYKISNVVNYIQQKFSSLYTPTRELSLDETLLLWKGRLSWVQHIRSKAARFGIKSFELCESSTGYLLRTILYAGKNSSFVEGHIDGFFNKTAKVVLELIDGFLDVGHLVVMDNWYNHLHLARYLKSRRTDVLGTLNAKRKFVPSDIKNANAKRMKRGERISRHCGDISVTTWKDVKLVTVLSTYHKDELIIGRRARQPFLKPSAIETYNKTMGGVDLKDMKLSNYPMERKKGNKWYIKVFARILNTSIVNAHIIHLKNSIENTLSHRKFRLALAQSLLAATQKTQVRRPLVSDDSIVRLDRIDHFPVHTEALTGKRKNFQRRRCKRCAVQGKRTEVNTMCSKCCAPLCVGQCWKDYHTLHKL